MIEYGLAKIIHLAALVFWLGPPLGAWFVLKAVGSKEFVSGSVEDKVNKMFYLTLILEHVAFVVLIASGVYLAVVFNMLSGAWLKQKILIISVIVVPLEILDVLLGNWLANTASKKLYAGRVPSQWEKRGLEIYHGIFTKIAILVMPLCVFALMYLATTKSALPL